MIQFNAKYLPALMPFRGIGDIRRYLAGINITPHEAGGALLVATNGHMLMCIYDRTAVCSEPATFVVGVDAAKFCTGRSGSADPVVLINPITERLTISGGQPRRELYVQPGKCLSDLGTTCPFPDWRRVVPRVADLKPGFSALAQAAYITKAAQAHPMRGERRNAPAMRFWQVNPTAPIIVEYEGAPEYMLVIMPYGRDTKSDAPACAEQWMSTFGQEPAADDTAPPLAQAA